MAESSLSTAPPPIGPDRIRKARGLRRAFFVLVTAVMLAALAGLFGATKGSASGSGGGYEVDIEYPRTTRSGLAAGLTITIRRAGGFAGPVSLAFESSYFDNFDVNGVDPEPIGATSTADRVIALFETPDEGDEMTVSYDARIQPGVILTRAKGSVSVVENGQDVATVNFETLVWP